MALERTWVALLNSPPVRRMRRSSAIRRLTSARTFEKLDRRRRRWRARAAARRHPEVFARLDTVCIFVGAVKSGGTLLGSMIDAHPDAVIADEVDVLDHLSLGFGRDELLYVLWRNARREALKGRVTARRLGGYSLAIPGQWQGRQRVVRVIGESRAGPTTRVLGQDRDNLGRLREFAHPARLRFIHVVRNPLDPIGAMVLRGGRRPDEACEDYAAQAARVERLRSWLEPEEMLTVHYERLLEEPDVVLSRIIEYLGLEHIPGHLAACVRLIETDRPGERSFHDWTRSELDRVRRLVQSHAFLAPYRDSIETRARS